MSRRQSVEQLWYTWSQSNIEGTGGFGIYAHSGGWPHLTKSEWQELRSYLHFEPTTSTESPMSNEGSFCWRRVGGRGVLIRKTPLGRDGFGRSGNFVAHALTDFEDDVNAHDVISLWGGGLPARSLPEDLAPTRELYPIDLVLGNSTSMYEPDEGIAEDPSLVACLSILVSDTVGCPLIEIAGTSERQIAELISRVTTAIPKEYQSRIFFDTNSGHSASDISTISGLVGEAIDSRSRIGSSIFSVSVSADGISGGKVGEQDRYRAALAARSSRRLAHVVLESRSAGEGYKKLSLDSYRRDVIALDLIGRSPTSIEGADVLEVLASHLAADWLRSVDERQVVPELFSKAAAHDAIGFARAVRSFALPGTSIRRVVLTTLIESSAVNGENCGEFLATLTPTGAEKAALYYLAWRTDIARSGRRTLSTKEVTTAASNYLLSFSQIWGTSAATDFLRLPALSNEIPLSVAFEGSTAVTLINLALDSSGNGDEFLIRVALRKVELLIDALLARPGHLDAANRAIAQIAANSEGCLSLVKNILLRGDRRLKSTLLVCLGEFNGSRLELHDTLRNDAVAVAHMFEIDVRLARALLPPAHLRRRYQWWSNIVARRG